ncbi:sensor histidine kinase [Roseateles sp. UC29_93]|uniref:sensor histidine kinase n=1 Tax=Roseateles sp. UC29_93 TaxID=3350177 RepID=UPI0002D60FAA
MSLLQESTSPRVFGVEAGHAPCASLDDPDEMARRLVAALPSAFLTRPGAWRPFVAELLAVDPSDTPMVTLGDGRQQWLLDQGAAVLSQHWTRYEQGLKPGALGVHVAEQKRSDILALVAHELRDPLAAIGSALKVLQLRANAQDAAERAIIERQLGTCLRVVGDLLDQSLVSRNTLTVHRLPIPVRGFLSTALEATAPGRETKRHRLMAFLPEVSVQVRGDSTRLSQVVGNLLSNATRYTPEDGCIELWTAQDAGQCVVHVKDNGQGIGVEQISRIFEPYVQGHRPPGAVYRGLGLGLALARAIVELHDGSLKVFSAGAGRGSEFCLTLPIWEPPPAR